MEGSPRGAQGRWAELRSGHGARWLAQHRPGLWTVGPIAVLAILAIVATYPVIVAPGSTVTSILGFDVSSSIAKFAAIVREGTTPFSGGRLESIGFPFGIPNTPGLDTASVLSALWLWLGSATVGAIAIHSLTSLLGLFLTGAVTFLFVRSITGSAVAGLVSGVAFGFFPHIRLLAGAAQTYTWMWLYILPLWAFTELIRRPSRGRALIAGASTLPALFWTPYYTYHVLVQALACGIVALVLLARREGVREALYRIALAAVPVLAGVAAYLAIGVATSFADAPERAAADLYTQSSHPLMYVIPGTTAWLWGEGPYETLVDVVPRAAGTNSYLGISVLLLGAVGAGWVIGRVLRAGWRRRADGPRSGPPPPAMLVAGCLALALAAFAFVWSLPPTVGIAGLDIPTPTRLTEAVAPSLRAGQRFVMPLMAGVAVLAGIGTARLLRPLSPRVGAVAGLALAAVVALDLVAIPNVRVSDVPPSHALAALRAAPAGAAIHYQDPIWGSMVEGAIARPCVFQTQHDHPLVNSCNLTSEPNVLGFQVDVSDPASCAVLDGLRANGVRYVIADAGIVAFAACRGVTPLAADDHFTVQRIA
jgi:hypothetical protein